MDWVDLESSSIKRVRYFSDEEHLEIEFPGKRQHAFKGVPMEIYSGLITSESPGKLFHSTIKGQFESAPVKKDKKEDK